MVVQIGEEMINPRSGERFGWRATHDSTQGAYREFDLYLSPDAKVAAPHRHPHQIEQLTVFTLTNTQTSGSYQPGEVAAIAADDAHRWANTTGQPAQVVVRLTPALNIEGYPTRSCAIATASRAASTGLPRNPLELGVLFDAYRDEFALSNRQVHQLASLITLLGLLGRRRGCTSGHPEERAHVGTKLGSPRSRSGCAVAGRPGERSSTSVTVGALSPRRSR